MATAMVSVFVIPDSLACKHRRRPQSSTEHICG
jgi:hypothetical protein